MLVHQETAATLRVPTSDRTSRNINSVVQKLHSIKKDKQKRPNLVLNRDKPSLRTPRGSLFPKTLIKACPTPKGNFNPLGVLTF